MPRYVPRASYGATMTELPVEIIRSKRRQRTLSARLVDGRLEVRIPAGMDPAEESRLVDQALERTHRKVDSAHVDIRKRANELAIRYQLPQPSHVEWSTRQKKRWGSCTPEQRSIRISDRLVDVPPWVLDSVLIHELAHLVESGHGPEFRELVNRYEMTERATGYLIAMGEGRYVGV